MIRAFSVLMKLIALGWVIFAFWLASQVIDSCTRDRAGCPEYSQVAYLYIAGAFVIPLMVGVFCLLLSFIVDLWLAVRRNNALLKSVYDLLDKRLSG